MNYLRYQKNGLKSSYMLTHRSRYTLVPHELELTLVTSNEIL